MNVRKAFSALAEVPYVDISSDGWTSVAKDQHRSQCNVFYSALHLKLGTQEFYLKNKVVYVSQTGVNVVEITGILHEYEITEKVKVIIEDNVANMTVDKAYRKTSNIRRTLVGNKIVDHSDEVGASPLGAAPTTSSFSTWHLASRDSAKKPASEYDNLLRVWIWCVLY